MEYQKKAEATTSDFISITIADAVRSKTFATRAKLYNGKKVKVSRNSRLNNSKQLQMNQHDKEIPKERYISRRKTSNY